MSTSKIILNNITITGVNNSLVVGELKILTPSPGAIDIPPQAEFIESNIILQKGDDENFKQCMNLSPVRPFDIKLYDQCGYLCNKWELDRHDNLSGNVRINSETKALFNNIEVPKELNGQTYLVISTYSGFERCIMNSSKKYLAEKDLSDFIKKTNVSNIILFISEHIKKELDDLGINLTTIFKQVYSSSVSTLILHFTEFIAGKSVAGSRPSFQGMINFGSNVEISTARFRNVKDTPHIECQIRRNGRIQINSENKNSAIKFFIILEHLNEQPIKVTEEFTKTDFPLIPYSIETLPGLNPEHFSALFTGFQFLEKLNANKDITKYANFASEHESNIVSYLFNSPLTIFEKLDIESELSQMIVEYGSTLRHQIYQTLITQASNVFLSENKKTTKIVQFNERDIYSNYMEPSRLYSSISNNYNIPNRLSSVPFSSVTTPQVLYDSNDLIDINENC
jgi:hypothetical protein